MKIALYVYAIIYRKEHPMFTYSLLDRTPEEAISIAYDHFSSEPLLSSFSDETRLTFYTAAIRTYCFSKPLLFKEYV